MSTRTAVILAVTGDLDATADFARFAALRRAGLAKWSTSVADGRLTVYAAFRLSRSDPWITGSVSSGPVRSRPGGPSDPWHQAAAETVAGFAIRHRERISA